MAKLKNYQIAIDGSADFAAPRRSHNPSNWWKYILTFLAGQLSLLIALVVGVSILATSFNAGVILGWFGQGDLLTDTYSEKTLFTLAMTLTDADHPFEVNKVSDLFAIVPQEKFEEIVPIGDLITDLEHVGITLDRTELYNTPFENMGDYVMENIYPATVVDKLLNGGGEEDPSTPAAMTKGIENEEVVVTFGDDDPGEGSGEGGGTSGGLSLDVTSAPLKVMFFKRDATTGEYLLEDGKLVPMNLNEFVEALPNIMNLTIGDLMGIDVNDPTTPAIMKSLAGMGLSDLIGGGFDVNSLLAGMTLEDVLGPQTGLMAKLGDAYLTSVPEDDPTGKTIAQKLDTLTLGEMLEIDESAGGILGYLAPFTISNVSSAIDGMYLSVVVGDNPTGLLAALAGYKVSEIGTAVDNLVVTDMFGDLFEENGELKEGNEIWKYLLTDPSQPLKTPYEIAGETKLTQFSDLMGNMTKNMATATINDLKNDGLISVSEGTDLTKTIPGSSNTKSIGEMTLGEMIEAVCSIDPTPGA